MAGVQVVRADRRTVEDVPLDGGEQGSERGGRHTGDGRMTQPLRGAVLVLGAVGVTRDDDRCRWVWSQGLAPGAVPVVRGQRQRGHDLVGHGDPGGIGAASQDLTLFLVRRRPWQPIIKK